MVLVSAGRGGKKKRRLWAQCYDMNNLGTMAGTWFGRELYLVDSSIYKISVFGYVMCLAVWLDICRAEYAESRQRKLAMEKGLMMIMVAAAPGKHGHPKHGVLL